MKTTVLALITGMLLGCSGSDDNSSSQPVGGNGGTTGASMCVATGNDCSADATSCCNGSTCVADTTKPNAGVCAANCTLNSDCNSACCTELANIPGAVCAPQSYCASICVEAGSSCAGDPNSCCADSVCVTDQSGSTCAALCLANAECKSNCCSRLDSGEFACMPPAYCGM